MDFKSLPQLLDYFKDQKTCVRYYEFIRWKGEIQCPHCGSYKIYRTNRGYKCGKSTCYRKFSVITDTIFENTKIPLRTWFAAIYLCTSHKKGISSIQLGIDLNITQKAAWFVLHRIREMLKKQAPNMVGGGGSMVESDATHIGGKEKNKHKSKRRNKENPELRNDGKPYVKKKIVIGIIERHGKIVLRHVPTETSNNMVSFIQDYVPSGSRIVTDEHLGYSELNKIYTHETVNHSLRIYVEGEKHTNTIENFWSLLKRGLYGIYHQVSDKHLDRYLDEFAARFNARNSSPYQNFHTFLADSKGKSLLYKNLTAND